MINMKYLVIIMTVMMISITTSMVSDIDATEYPTYIKVSTDKDEYVAGSTVYFTGTISVKNTPSNVICIIFYEGEQIQKYLIPVTGEMFSSQVDIVQSGEYQITIMNEYTPRDMEDLHISNMAITSHVFNVVEKNIFVNLE